MVCFAQEGAGGQPLDEGEPEEPEKGQDGDADEEEGEVPGEEKGGGRRGGDGEEGGYAGAWTTASRGTLLSSMCPVFVLTLVAVLAVFLHGVVNSSGS